MIAVYFTMVFVLNKFGINI